MLQWSQLGELADTLRGLSIKATAIVAVAFNLLSCRKPDFVDLVVAKSKKVYFFGLKCSLVLKICSFETKQQFLLSILKIKIPPVW